MNKIRHRALTYSLLAHIRGKGKLISGPIELFVPLVKRTLSKLNEKGIYSGKSIVEIKQESDSLYGIDFPIPVLRTILSTIAKEVNSKEERHFELFQDDAFQIKNYAFTEFEETIRIQTIEIENLEKLFQKFCETCGVNKPEKSSIVEFIERNKLSLSKYLAHKKIDQTKDFTIEAQFVDFFKQFPSVYDEIRKIYLGSILVGYIEYRTEDIKTNIELLLDTNFILGLLDLNTPESTHTCRKVIEITKAQGYKLTVLRDTINETTALLKAKTENFDLTFLQKKIYPEDIYNACDRRNLNIADLERITDRLEEDLNSYGINVIHDTTKYRNLAKFSSEFEAFKRHRHSDAAALHDATALYYIRDKRKKKIKEFADVNCWFINNSVNRDKYGDIDKDSGREYQPEVIKADDFLNIIWLSNPQIERSLDIDAVSEIGLTSLISAGLTSSLPKLSIIRELDDNIHKYAQDSGLSDIDIVRVATRITTKQLIDIENLNKLAKENKELFVKRLNDEAARQKELEEERIKKIEKVLHDFNQKNAALAKIKNDFEQKAKKIDEKNTKIKDLTVKLDEETALRRKIEKQAKRDKVDQFIDKKVRRWRNQTIIELILWVVLAVGSLIWLFYEAKWQINTAIDLYQHLQKNVLFSTFLLLLGTVFSTVTYQKWFMKNHNHSNIENYKKGLKLPIELQDEE